MNGTFPAEQGFVWKHDDPRLGIPTAILGGWPHDQQRPACVALNRERTKGIRQAFEQAPSRGAVSLDDWQEAFETLCRRHRVPLIDLEQLGIFHDEDSLISSRILIPLRPGAEASPFRDDAFGVVYKLFDLRIDGSLGKAATLVSRGEGRFDVELRNADLMTTLAKLALLNQAGGLPTEIAGLSTDGNYLVVKQPLAKEIPDQTAGSRLLKQNQHKALGMMYGLLPETTTCSRTVGVLWLNGEGWLVTDLHERNIMLDDRNRPSVIDALVAPVPVEYLRDCRWLRNAVDDARCLREGRPITRIEFGEGVSDDDL